MSQVISHAEFGTAVERLARTLSARGFLPERDADTDSKVSWAVTVNGVPLVVTLEIPPGHVMEDIMADHWSRS